MKIVTLDEKSISNAGIRGMKAGQLLREELEAKNKLKKHLWDLWSLSNGEIGEKPPEEEMKKWK